MAALEMRLDSPSLDRLGRRLREYQGRYRANLVRARANAARIAIEEAARLAPVSFAPHFYARESGSGDRVEVHIGVDTGAKPHAPYVDLGTGVYRTPPRQRWTVRPVRARALRFMVGGRLVFARSATIRGMRGRHFMRRGLLASRPRISRSLASSQAAVTRSLRGR
jgi:hypothetical protein